MKKTVFLFLVSFLLFTAGCSKSDNENSQALSSEEKKAVSALEEFFHLVGQEDAKNLEKHATEPGLQNGLLIIAFASKEEKDSLKNFKADPSDIELQDNRFSCTITLFNAPDRVELIKEGNTWKFNDFIGMKNEKVLSDTYNVDMFEPITSGSGKYDD